MGPHFDRHASRRFCRWLAILIAGCSLAAPASGRVTCVVQQMTSVSLSVVGGSILLPVEVNGTVASFVLDTGAQRSVVTDAAIARLHLARDPWVGTTMSGFGGVNDRANADPRSFSLGGVPLVRHTLNRDTSLTVGILPRSTTALGPVIDGLLGRDYLATFDLDLDVPERRLTLYRPSGCSGRFLPWSGNYAAVPMSNPTENALVVPVVLDGTPLRALLESGASSSLLGASGMFRLRINEMELRSDPTDQISGLGPHLMMMHRHQFHSLRVGPQVTDAPSIWVAQVPLRPVVDMLLGADWLGGRRVWISYATHQLFVATP